MGQRIDKPYFSEEDIERIKKSLKPKDDRVYKEFISDESISAPSGMLFYLDYKYDTNDK